MMECLRFKVQGSRCDGMGCVRWVSRRLDGWMVRWGEYFGFLMGWIDGESVRSLTMAVSYLLYWLAGAFL